MFGALRNAWAQVLTVLLGLWLMAAPAVLGYSGTPADVHRVLGPVTAAVALIAAWGHMRPLRWMSVPLGGAIAATPFVWSFGTVALANGVVVGLAVVALAFVSGRITEDYGGGWSSLWTGNVSGDRTREH